MRDKITQRWEQFRTWLHWQQQYFWYGLYTLLTKAKKAVKSRIQDQIVVQSIEARHGEETPLNYGRGKWFYR